jgi:hypothetical protein
MNRYYIIDTGQKMLEAAKVLEKYCVANKFHYVMYLTGEEYYLAMEELNEEEFLDHFTNSNKNTTNG